MERLNAETLQQLRDDENGLRRLQEWAWNTLQAVVEIAPVQEWFGRRYAVIGRIRLAAGPQTVEVVDVTDRNVALVAPSLFDNGGRFARTCAIVLRPMEGHTSVVCQDADGYVSEPWVRIADLPIQIGPAAQEYRRQVREQQDAALEASVDAGGGIGL